MKKEKHRLLRWILINSGFVFCIYHALFKESGIAQNITIFLVNIQAFAVIIGLTSKKMQKEQREKGSTIPLWLDHIYDVAIGLTFAAYGWFWSATVFALTIIFLNIVHNGKYDDETI